jgi:hypothetical protein
MKSSLDQVYEFDSRSKIYGYEGMASIAILFVIQTIGIVGIGDMDISTIIGTVVVVLCTAPFFGWGIIIQERVRKFLRDSGFRDLNGYKIVLPYEKEIVPESTKFEGFDGAV